MTVPTFVVFEGKVDGVLNPAGAYDDEVSARADYNAQIKMGLASRDVGLFLGRLDAVQESDVDRVYNQTPELADQHFAGYGLVILDAFTSDISDWADGAFTVTDEDFDQGNSDYLIR